MELLLDILGCGVSLYDFDTAKRLVEHADHIAQALLTLACRVAQLLDDATDNKAHQRQEQHRKECQLPRDIQHQHNVSDNKERLTEQHLQSIGNTELHNTHIGCDTRHNIALALTAEVAYILADNTIEHSVAHTQNGLHTHLLNRITTQIAEEVREEIHHNQDHRQQHKYIGDIPSVAEDIRISVIQPQLQRLALERQLRHLSNGYKDVVLVEHCVQDWDNHCVVEGIEHGVQSGKEEVWHSVPTYWLRKAEQSQISLKHSVLFLLNQTLLVVLVYRLDVVSDSLVHRHKRLTTCGILVTSAIEVTTSKGVDIDISS